MHLHLSSVLDVRTVRLALEVMEQQARMCSLYPCSCHSYFEFSARLHASVFGAPDREPGIKYKEDYDTEDESSNATENDKDASACPNENSNNNNTSAEQQANNAQMKEGSNVEEDEEQSTDNENKSDESDESDTSDIEKGAYSGIVQ
jgi:hypothetical protein